MATLEFKNDYKEKRIALLQRGFFVAKGPVDVAEIVKVDSVENLSDKLTEFFEKFEGRYAGKSVTVFLNDTLYGFYYLSKDGTWKPSENLN